MSARETHRLRAVGALAAVFVVVCHAVPAAAVEKAVCVTAADDGQRLRKAHKLVAARAEFLVCAQADCPNVVSQDCVQWLGSVERSLASVIVRAHDPNGTELADVRVSVDGKLIAEHPTTAAIEVDPGPHLVRYEAKGFEPVEEPLSLGEGERGHPLRAELRQAPSVQAPAPGRIPAVAWAFGGLGVVGAGSFVAFALVGQSEQRSLRTTCAPNCSPAQIAPLQTKFTVANISLGVGVVALATGVTIALVGTLRGSGPAAKASAVLVHLAHGWEW
jgi:hypothetical protein